MRCQYRPLHACAEPKLHRVSDSLAVLKPLPLPAAAHSAVVTCVVRISVVTDIAWSKYYSFDVV